MGSALQRCPEARVRRVSRLRLHACSTASAASVTLCEPRGSRAAPPPARAASSRHRDRRGRRTGPRVTRRRSPVRNFGAVGRSIRPSVSRPLRSTMTSSGTAAGGVPFMTRRTTPGSPSRACATAARSRRTGSPGTATASAPPCGRCAVRGSESRRVGPKPAWLEAMERQPVALGLELRSGPVRHGTPIPLADCRTPE